MQFDFPNLLILLYFSHHQHRFKCLSSGTGVYGILGNLHLMETLPAVSAAGSQSGPGSEKQSPMTQKQSPHTQPSPGAQPGQVGVHPGQTAIQPGQTVSAPSAQTSQTGSVPPPPAASSQPPPVGSQQSPVAQPTGLPPQLYLHDGR